jgi:hypothetical protein
VIAKEVGKAYSTKRERAAATEFARSHRLSIANAFERKLVRKDVVAALSAMLEAIRVDRFPSGRNRV